MAETITKAVQANLDQAVVAIVEAMEKVEGKLPNKKRAIVEAAILEFAQGGFDATSTRQIANRAEVAEATIFRHFPTKVDLLLRLIEPVFDELLVPAAEDELQEISLRHNNEPGPILREVLLSRLTFFRRYLPLVRIIMQELPFQAALQKSIAADVSRMQLRVDALLKSQSTAGHIRNIPTDRLMRIVVGLFMSYFVASTYWPDSNPNNDEEEVAAMVDILLNGISVLP